MTVKEDLNKVTRLNTPEILNSVIRALHREHLPDNPLCLDIGSGNGELIELLRKEFKAKTKACDFTDALMRVEDQQVDKIDLNRENLPYADECFDVITITEVIEHIENFRGAFREIYRCLKKEGVIVVTTPNILNLKSRIRFLFFGFWNLFGPLHLNDSRKYSAGGHISPISPFYILHSLAETGFGDIHYDIDKRQSSSLILYYLLILKIKIYVRLAMRRERHRYHTVSDSNEWMVKCLNSKAILLGRTLIVSAKKQ